MTKSDVATSPVVPGHFLVFIERLVQEQYQMQVVEAASEQQARDQAIAQFFAGRIAYMSSAQVQPPTARVRPVREKHLRKLAARDTMSDVAGLRTASRFHGADEELLQPLSVYPGTDPRPVTRSQARLLCQNFDASGHSNHSGKGATLWVILEHCAAVDIAYNLRAMPGMGYYVEHAKTVGDGLGLRMSVETGYGPLHD